MLALNTDKLQVIGLCASLIAVVGLGSSMIAGNELELVGSVSVTHQKALLLLASIIALRGLYLRALHLRMQRSLDGNRVVGVAELRKQETKVIHDGNGNKGRNGIQ
jgi:hypothetical protein